MQSLTDQSPDSSASILGPAFVPTKKLESPDLKNRNKKKGQVVLALSFAALVAYSVFFFYENADAYLRAPAEINALEDELNHYQNEVIPQLEKMKNIHKAAHDSELQEMKGALDIVFPKNADKLGMVQLLESFATEVDLISPPFEFTSMEVGEVETHPGYQITPISTTIHSSQAGFEKFLALVEASGLIYEGGEAEEKVLSDNMVRLMSISSISLKYRGVNPETGKDDGLDFSVKLNVYSRP